MTFKINHLSIKNKVEIIHIIFDGYFKIDEEGEYPYNLSLFEVVYLNFLKKRSVEKIEAIKNLL